MTTPSSVWNWVRNKEWALVVSIVTAILVEAPGIVDTINDGVDTAGDNLSWFGLIVLIAGAVIRSNVWSRMSVETDSDVTADMIAERITGRQPPT